MRKSILLFLVAGCAGDAMPDDYTVVDAVPDRAVAVQCEPIELPGDPSPSEIRLATDSTWSLLDDQRREVLYLDDRMRVLARTPLAEDGPGAAPNPVSAVALGDTAWAVAARGGLRLVILDHGGREISTTPLGFVPHSIEAAPNGDLLMSAMPFGSKPPTVVVRMRDGELSYVPVPKRSYPDMTVAALGNTALVETLSDGTALVLHQFMAPRGFRVSPTDQVEPLPVPTPAGTRESVDYVPTSPITEDQLPLALVPAMAMSVDDQAQEVFLMTRSGREVDGRLERVIMRLDSSLGFKAGYTLDVHASGMLYLPRIGRALVYDDVARFHTCPLPGLET